MEQSVGMGMRGVTGRKVRTEQCSPIARGGGGIFGWRGRVAEPDSHCPCSRLVVGAVAKAKASRSRPATLLLTGTGRAR